MVKYSNSNHAITSIDSFCHNFAFSLLTLTHSPTEIVLLGGSMVFLHQLLHHLSTVLEVVQAVCKQGLLLELFNVGASLEHLVKVPAGLGEQRGDAGVVGHHEA